MQMQSNHSDKVKEALIAMYTMVGLCAIFK